MTQTQKTYCLTLIALDGRKLAVIPESPILPRFLHLRDHDDAQTVELSDDPDPSDNDKFESAATFARVGGSVWVDDERSALYVVVA